MIHHEAPSAFRADMFYRRFEIAKDQVSKGRYFEAKRELDLVISNFSDESSKPRLYGEYDYIQLTLGMVQESEAMWEAAINQKPNNETLLKALVESAMRARRYRVAKGRLKQAESIYSEEQCLFLQLKCLNGGFETEEGRRLHKSVRDVPEEIWTFIKLDGLFADRRYKEALSSIDNYFFERSIEKLKSRTSAQIGAGCHKAVENDLAIHRVYYASPEWIEFDLARNAEMAKWRELAVSRWSALADRFGSRPEVIRSFVNALASTLEFERAEHFLRSCEDELDPAFYLFLMANIYRLQGRFEPALSILVDVVGQFVGKSPVRLIAQAYSDIAKLRLRQFSKDGSTTALEMHLEAARNARGIDAENLVMKTRLIDALIRSNKHSEARTEIKKLPKNYRPDTLRLRTWLADLDNDNVEARRLWGVRKAIHYIPQVENSKFSFLERLDENPVFPVKDTALYTVIQNERFRLKWFLDYYRGIGVENFVFVDNGSVDGSVEYLLSQSDVILYSTKDNYYEAFAGVNWLNRLVAEHSHKAWVLYSDVDEALVYDRSEFRTINDLIAQLEARSEEAFVAFMLDMYNVERAPSEHPIASEDFIAAYPYYQSTYFRNNAPVCPYFNIRGGARRVFGTAEELVKTPLYKASTGIDLLRSSHNISPAKVSELNGAMLHFKMIDGIKAEAEAVLSKFDRNPDCQMRYKKYLDIDVVEGFRVNAPTDQRKFTGSSDLVEQGLISRVFS